MCGIVGFVQSPGADRPDPDLVGRMLARLSHRGPDGTGIYRDDTATLGHARLAVIDVAGGAQPMGTQDGQAWITFNGEIFNYLELREELRGLGHRFRTESDTEVILHAWQEWGRGAFGRFNGDWALAIWEPGQERLVLARDRIGVRPLFYSQRPDRFVFASEVKAIFADPAVPRALDRVGLAQTMTFWSAVAPRTVFEGIEQLPPGHLAFLSRGDLRVEPYWRPTFSGDAPGEGDAARQDLGANAAELRERLIEAVRLRFERSDVPVAAYLSGGIDSTITAGIIASHTAAELETFSLRFADTDFDEGTFQQDAVRRLGTTHHQITVTAQDIGEVLPEVVRHAESPFLRAAPAPMFLLSRLVRDRGYKVVVTGEGADEVLAGYDIFREARLREFIARNPDSPVRARGLELLYPWMARSPGQAPAFAREFFGRGLDLGDPAFSHRPRWESTATLIGMVVEHPGWSTDVVGELTADLPADWSSWSQLDRAQWWELTTLLPGYILSSQGDRMLMGNSVEGRFPFLDKEVLELAGQLPGRHKLLGLDEKHVLKKAFADLVPESVLNRPKQPYRSPDASAVFGAALPGAAQSSPAWVEEVTSPEVVREAGVFEPEIVSGLMAKGRRRGGNRMSNTDNMRVLAVLTTQLIHQQFIAGDGAAASGTGTAVADPAVLIDRSAATSRRMS